MKKSTASSAMSPGKNKYIAFLNPIASPTCSTKMPRVPAMTFITKRKNAVQTPRVLAGTISTMTVKRIANQVSANR
jgi:hypothetical protein